eukprot:m.477346 g.477346  ORF g.477346 m.477346 type:complete len:544 (-) comp20810_c0_seq1:107-1738(-)
MASANASKIAHTNPDVLKVTSPNVTYTDDAIVSNYSYETTAVTVEGGELRATPMKTEYQLKTSTKVPKLGLMLVGWGGNNGSTVTGATIANRDNISWNARQGKLEPNYFGSVTQATTLRVGTDPSGNDIYIPFNKILPMVNPNDLVIGGWDISKLNLAEAMERACVFDYDLRRQLAPKMKDMVPLPGIYYPDFIAANQSDRADNVLEGSDKQAHLDKIRQDIREFKASNSLDKVIVLWTANTERFCDLIDGVNDTADNLLAALKASHEEVSPSTVYGVASVLEGCSFINGSPQNTCVPGLIELAERRRVFLGGDDFKSGQTKMKSVLVDFLVNAGIKPVSITSYNHLGNNDGHNLSAPSQFRSKEISKSNVVDDMVESNRILYKEGEHPDHVVVIKYVPAVGDSKRALDEYMSEIFMHGTNTISMHNTCEDSLLASPLILDLAILCELMERIEWKSGDMAEFDSFNSVCSILSYLLKAPLVPQGAPVVNALFKQRAAMENLFKACVGLPPENHLQLEHRAVHHHSRDAAATAEATATAAASAE